MNIWKFYTHTGAMTLSQEKITENSEKKVKKKINKNTRGNIRYHNLCIESKSAETYSLKYNI